MAAVETLRSLAEKARRKELPNRHELVAIALEIGATALEMTRTYFNEDGEEHTIPMAQPAVALKSVEVAAHLALKEAPQPAAAPDELRQQLDAMGYMLVKKPDADHGNGAQH